MTFRHGSEVISSSPERVVGLVGQLLSNALSHTQVGFVQLTVQLEVDAHGAHWIEFVVEDSGVGLPEGAHESIFEPFTQMQETKNRGHGSGIGLGLAICRQLAQLMGGSIVCVPREPSGSTFTVRLPYEESE